MKTTKDEYLFFYEDDKELKYTYTVKAFGSAEAYDIAYESYGPEIEGMMYKKRNKTCV